MRKISNSAESTLNVWRVFCCRCGGRWYPDTHYEAYGECLGQPDDHVVAKGDDIFLTSCVLESLLAGSGPRHYLVLPGQSQALSLVLSLQTLSSDWLDYEVAFTSALLCLKDRAKD